MFIWSRINYITIAWSNLIPKPDKVKPLKFAYFVVHSSSVPTIEALVLASDLKSTHECTWHWCFLSLFFAAIERVCGNSSTSKLSSECGKWLRFSLACEYHVCRYHIHLVAPNIYISVRGSWSAPSEWFENFSNIFLISIDSFFARSNPLYSENDSTSILSIPSDDIQIWIFAIKTR